MPTDDGDRLLLLVELLDGMPLQADVLGTTWTVGPTPRPCTLVLPRQPLEDDDFHQLTRPSVDGASAAVDTLESYATDEWSVWGNGDRSGPS